MFEQFVCLANSVGTVAFALAGIQLIAWDKPHAWIKSLLTSFLCSFGGGLTRDVIILRCKPAILCSQDSLAIMLITFMVYGILHILGRTWIFEKPFVKFMLIIFDAAGVATFVCAGVDAARVCGATGGILLLSGVMTAIGGGIWAALASGQGIASILRAAFGYRLIVVTHALIYIVGNVSSSSTDYILVITLILTCITSCCIRNQLIHADEVNHAYEMRNKQNLYNKIGLSVSTAQLFWSIVNPTKGNHTYEVIFVYKGAKALFLYFISELLK